MRATATAFLLILLASLASAAPAAARSRVPVVVVPVGGSPLAREVASLLEAKGVFVELAPMPAPPPASLPVDQASACVREGHELAFRLEYGAAIAALESCLERVGPGLARPEGAPALSALLVELGAAAVGAGERERARSAFARLARLAAPVPPDPGVHPPPVMQAWEEARRGADAGRPVLVEAVPPWTDVWIDGRPVAPGERVTLSQGPHFASADAAGFAPWSGTLLVDADTARVPVRLVPLDREARAASVRARASTIPAGAPGAAEELTAAFSAAVVVVSGGRGGAASAVLLLPSDPGKGAGAAVGGRWSPAGEEPAASVIATGVARRLGAGGFRVKKKTLYIAGGTLAGILAVGAAAALLSGGGDAPAGDKEGSVVWEPPPPALPPHGPP